MKLDLSREKFNYSGLVLLKYVKLITVVSTAYDYKGFAPLPGFSLPPFAPTSFSNLETPLLITEDNFDFTLFSLCYRFGAIFWIFFFYKVLLLKFGQTFYMKLLLNYTVHSFSRLQCLCISTRVLSRSKPYA